MDHFAKPDDELAIAQRDNKLYRNFQGYSTHSDCDLIGLGITSIGRVADSYIQNVKDLAAYDAAIKLGALPVFKGFVLNDDDKLHRAVITQLICHFSLSFEQIEQQYAIQFRDYFSDELTVLHSMQKDTLLTMDDKGIYVLTAGRLLIRNICMIFDRYLNASRQQFSKVI
ncbi:oxygen-independent coproporphyrinogen III oxidase [methanotrophic bacterial endosymbiont of Bathymodiolus sp.]|nr:oxygen-independent coproporphyrinogen III oxidase [methanotrophic bacterial endosymbiont of Bathymodiolus sp.]